MERLHTKLPHRLEERYRTLHLIKRSGKSQPLASALIRVRNEAGNLRRLLESLERQSLYPELELIFLDSGSTDGTLEMLGDRECSIYRIEGHEFSFGETCNILMALSSTPVCFFFSGHVVIRESHALGSAYEEITSGGAAAGYFRQVPNWHCGASAYEQVFLRRNFPERQSQRRYKPQRFSNAASVLSRMAWEKLWFPDVVANEDALWAREFARRKLGVVKYFPNLAVEHSHNESPERLEHRVYLNASARKGGLFAVVRVTLRFLPMLWSLLAVGAGFEEAFRYSLAHLRGYVRSLRTRT